MAGVIEGIVVIGVTEILKKLIPVITEQIGLASGVEDELEKLKNTLEMIKAVVTDAERRQMTDEAVKLWLKKLKDFAYDVDDILDAHLHKCMQKHEWMNRKRDQVLYYASPSTNPVVSRFKLGNKIKKINLMFDQIALEKNQLGLQPYASPLDRTSDVIDESFNRKTYAFLDSSENIVGRETDKRNILKMLLPTHTHDQVEKVSVIPIVGMGGTGKTTLAQLVYNDESIEKHFDLKIWVCISDDFNIKIILENVIESITKIKCDDLSNIDVLVQELHTNLTGKKYLLVFDDMWNRNGEKWAKLKELLSVGAQGSKIIITTRVDDVAKIVVGNNPIYNLEVLKEDECCSIFKKLAFGTGGPVETPILSDIANQLVKKCKGLPLAVKTLGSLMHSKKDERDWVFMKDNEILNIPEDQSGIFRILKLSYDHLPSHLKQCFSYCAIFPKDYRIKRETLIQLWMAEGFIQPYEGNDKLVIEDIGNDYFYSLLGNSLLQDIEVDKFGDVKACKMHDLVHDLAQVVSGPHECLIVEASKIGDISEVRRLHLVNFVDEMSLVRVSAALKKAKKLRTLFVNCNGKIIITNMIKELFHNNSLLRVLDLSLSTIGELPSEIGNLKHLRYLDLYCKSRFRDTVNIELPNSISTLYHLQTLKSTFKLPKDTNKLINLRHSHIHMFLLPWRLGQLTCLRTLKKIMVNRDGPSGDGYGIEELGSLNSISGDLRIYHLQNVQGGRCASRRANLEGKPNLRSLSLHWSFDSFSNRNDEMVLEGLQPHPHLKSLEIRLFRGTILPTWMGVSSCLPNLVVLRLKGCKGVEQLPSLGELPLLRILDIERLEGVRCLGKEFHGTGGAGTATMKSKAAFPSLKEFTLQKMYNLEEWVVEEEQQQQFPSTTSTSFPRLEKLAIMDCSRLKVVPTRVFPSLTELVISKIEGGMTVSSMVTGNLTSLTKVDISDVKELQFLPQALLLNNTDLQSLAISCCRKFEGFIISKEVQVQLSGNTPPGPGPLHHLGSSSSSSSNNTYTNSSLQYLKIDYCHALKFLPDFRCFTSLRELTIKDCTYLTEWMELQQQQQQQFFSSFPHLESLKIIGSYRLNVAVTLFPSLKELYVDGMRDIILKPPTVSRDLTSLTKVDIRLVLELQFLPQGLLLNNNSPLQYLSISCCSKFKGFVISKEEEEEVVLSKDSPSLDLGGRNINSSLKSLKLLQCPVLTSLPDLSYFTSLRELIIEECKELMELLPDEDDIKKCLPSLEVLRMKKYADEDPVELSRCVHAGQDNTALNQDFNILEELDTCKSWWRRLGICKLN